MPLSDERALEVRQLIKELRLNTVCQQARCPNIGECFSHATATFLILGDVCTRNCRFCAIEPGKPEPPDPEEPLRVAKAVKQLKLKHCVITGVNRDDLSLSGAEQYAETTRRVKLMNPGTKVEILPGDFSGSEAALKTVLEADPEVFNHNLETVQRLTSIVRDRRANYRTSLQILERAKRLRPDILTKSGLLLGLGETFDEIITTLNDLRGVDCDGVTIGQYIPPSPKHHPVEKYYPPEEFRELEETAREMGFIGAAAAPLVRSSYRAADFFASNKMVEDRNKLTVPI